MHANVKDQTETNEADFQEVDCICWLPGGSFQLQAGVSLSGGLGARVSGQVYLASYALAHLTKGSSEICVSKKLCKYVPWLDKNFAKFHSAIYGHYRTNMPQFMQQIREASQGNSGESKRLAYRQTTLDWNFHSATCTCVTLQKKYHLSGPQFPRL